MRTSFYLFCVAVIFCLGCQHTRNHKGEPTPSPSASVLTETERHYLTIYGKVRKRVTDAGHLPEYATAEELRPRIAEFLKCTPDATWEEILHAPFVRRLCTEKAREKFVAIFRLQPDATWIELGLHVDALWTQLQKEQSKHSAQVRR